MEEVKLGEWEEPGRLEAPERLEARARSPKSARSTQSPTPSRARRARPDLQLKVTDVKQFIYCPRIIYFTYLMPVERRITRKMAYGKESHAELDRLERRRGFRAYRLEEAERRFHVPLASDRLGMRGILDMLLVSPGGYFPVEFKDTSRRPGLNHKYQLVAYAMLVEEVYRQPVREGYIYLIPAQKAIVIPITQGMRDFVRSAVSKIEEMVLTEKIPAITREIRKCVDCEWRNYCGDRGFSFSSEERDGRAEGCTF